MTLLGGSGIADTSGCSVNCVGMGCPGRVTLCVLLANTDGPSPGVIALVSRDISFAVGGVVLERWIPATCANFCQYERRLADVHVHQNVQELAPTSFLRVERRADHTLDVCARCGVTKHCVPPWALSAPATDARLTRTTYIHLTRLDRPTALACHCVGFGVGDPLDQFVGSRVLS